MRELSELDRERILQAEAEHRAAADTVKQFLRRHPDPDVAELREFCPMVRRRCRAAIAGRAGARPLKWQDVVSSTCPRDMTKEEGRHRGSENP
jgi:hypothetical protein